MENVNPCLSYQIAWIFAPEKAQEGIIKKELGFPFQECLLEACFILHEMLHIVYTTPSCDTK